ncbi:MAG: prenyltransferase [Deltaproteobacteria bacterium]|nr:prenyltransferase [Deltaproteobacteria bacterium]MBW2002510.1 prenyltransferase [Deltaproteobacteria bacterium]
MIKIFLKALRLPFLAGSIMPVIITAAFAFHRGSFSLLPFVIAIIGVGALHLGSNCINDYYDSKGSDPINIRFTPFSGGSRVIQENELRPNTILAVSIVFFSLGITCGLWFTFWGRPYVLLIGLSGLLAGWAYSSPPLSLMSHGLGEALIFFAFGPLITLGTYYVITNHLFWPAFLLGIPHGFLIMAVIWINQFPDYQADKKANKKNLVVRLGLSKARYVYSLMMLLPFLLMILLIYSIGLPFLVIISLGAFLLAKRAIQILWKEYLSFQNIIPAQALTIHTLICMGLLVSGSLFISKIMGA